MTNKEPVADEGAQSADPSGYSGQGLPAADRHDSVKQALRDVRHTRTKSAWVGVIVGAVVLIALLVFIVQNLDNQKTHLFFWTVSLPQGVSLLIAAIAGALITAVIGGARMFQVRRAVRKA